MSIELDKSVEIARGLPKRQREVLRGLSQGKQRKEIADELHISHGTVNRHCEMLYQRIGVNNAREAIRIASFAGLL
jgi:two-component system, NarL family, nitrate/nitrite response regulator NarL